MARRLPGSSPRKGRRGAVAAGGEGGPPAGDAPTPAAGARKQAARHAGAPKIAARKPPTTGAPPGTSPGAKRPRKTAPGPSRAVAARPPAAAPSGEDARPGAPPRRGRTAATDSSGTATAAQARPRGQAPPAGTPERARAASARTPERARAAPARTPEPDPPASAHTPEPDPPASAHTPEPDPPASAHTPEPDPPASAHTPEPDPPAPARTPRHEVAAPAPARRTRKAKPAGPQPLPSREEIRRFIAASGGRRVGKTEIARHFGLTTDQRPALRGLLASLKAEGAAAPAGRRGLAAPAPRQGSDRLPEMLVVEVTGIDADGDPIARPAGWRAAEQGRPPVIFMQPEAKGHAALAPGQKVLARLRPVGEGKYEGRTVKRIAGAAPGRILGVFEEGRIIPTDRRSRAEWMVPAGEAAGAEPGEIVLAEPLPSHRHYGPRPARIVERLGRMGEPRSVSLICIHAHGIPDIFPAEAVQEAERARAVTARGREDLRQVPLVTIDGADARDFDDAVWAEPDGGAGWKVLVAIADVAHYVRPGSALDREAWARGNSVYFPDRVVPMLPEALSNGWCSLRPGENRGCLFVEMWFDQAGTKTRHRFGRGIMRSAARLTYEQVQAAQDAGTDPEGLAQGHVARLYGAFRALLAARERRGTLDLDLPERRVLLDARGNVTGVEPRPRLDSHRLIEEFMVAANVCAAEELERLRQPCMYRIHDRPSDEKLHNLGEFLHGLGISLPPADRLHPRNFSHLLGLVRGRPEERIVNETVLRSQSQAAYSPDNIGHFGLALARYAHFTSPIRRYADLLVHRALIRGLGLSGTGALEETEAARFPDTAEHITATERRAAQAERDAVDRYLAAFMAQRVGEVFRARISGVTRFGLFVTVEENGASGIVPLASLPDDRWIEDQATHSLAGSRTGLRFALGQEVEARLAQATPRTGGMVFHLMQGAPPPRARQGRFRPDDAPPPASPHRGKGAPGPKRKGGHKGSPKGGHRFRR